MRRQFDLTFTALQVPLDLLALLGAALAAYTLRYSEAFIEIRPLFTQIDFGDYMVTAALFSLVWICVFAVAGLYSTRELRAWSELGRLIISCTAGAMILIAAVFFQREFTTSRFIVIAVWVLSILFVFLERLIVRVIRHLLLRAKIGHKRVVIIGQGKAADELADLYKKNPVMGFSVKRRFKNWSSQTAHDLHRLMKRRNVDQILLADPSIPKEHALELIAIAEEHNIVFKYLADLFAASFTRIEVTANGGIPIIEVQRTPLEGWGRIYKRVFDILVSLLLILLTSPLMILAAILIKLTSKGSVFFSKLPNGKQVQRVGEDGVPFHYFKFRTMYQDVDKLRYDPEFQKKHGEHRQGPLVKFKNDPRVTPVGRILRKFSIDELPEFFLVLQGKISLVGPRPHLPEEVEKYKPHQRRVLGIKPGITGMAQISGRADLDFDDEVKIDTWYIENWSPALDLWILLKTPFVVVKGKGAY
ncbi:exopolysaccharide biosynthesis polyprenyl glycosylphosphotransferase [Candidatus Uhrbacteria bacterium]|nr:exopolysaccharide biosynthesis polyprenyl glycosylphosphotransferase [Candidatus Uhrbacteria bacterium]MBD3283970.1 exopolysaccharide biosynthesis polyprenyl glycosylphosphotransferase [Candidatus Uhrbacteria bacterium]